MTWLLVGGAGYIGSHLAHEFHGEGLPVVVMDDLSTGRAESLPSGVILEVGDACDASAVDAVMAKHSVTGVVHLAAYKHARESVSFPTKYWRANLGALLGVLDAAQNHPIESVILSSSCSVYGSVALSGRPSGLNPQSPYANTKAASEVLLWDWSRATGVAATVLRYFNVVGNGPFPLAPDRSTHCLVPTAFQAICRGEAPVVFGTDFETDDGSALRDFLDVRDLARAHTLIANDVLLGGGSITRNKVLDVSTGVPISVLEVMGLVSELTSWSGGLVMSDRRPGDPARAWTETSHELLELGWLTRFDIRASIESHVLHPDAETARAV